jgi:Rap guanine nucleotide exchange factor 4
VIKICAADKLQLNRGPDDLALVEVKSNGERTTFKDNDLSIPTALSLNGRLFISPRDHMDALTALPEQEGATEGLEMDIEALTTKDLAYHMTLFDWDLFWAVHEYELLYHTFGRHHFNKVSE